MSAGQNGLFWETGDSVEFDDVRNGNTVWSLLDIAHAYFGSHAASFEPALISPFFSVVLSSYREFLTWGTTKGFDPSSENVQAQMIFCYRKLDRRFYIYSGKLWKRPSEDAAIERDGEYADQFESSRMHVFGEPAIKEELISGHHPDYDDLRQDTNVMSVVRGGGRADSLNFVSVERVLQTLIRRMSESAGKLRAAETVSPACDCYLVPKTGTPRALAARP